MKYILVDNGSLRAESVLNLRRVAALLSEKVGVEVIPASLLHSSKVPARELENIPAVNLERRLRWCLESGEKEFTVVPFFFGPTGAILDYLPQRLTFLREKYGKFTIQRVPFLFDESCEHDNGLLVSILADNIRSTMARHNLSRPRIALVDHGSPLRAVSDVRNSIAGILEEILGDEVAGVAACSMERRPGDAFAFNEPLLEKLLLREDWRDGNVVVAMLFLSPGRHAGPNGDIATICRQAISRSPGLNTFMTDLVGTHPLVIELLAARLTGRRLPLE